VFVGIGSISQFMQDHLGTFCVSIHKTHLEQHRLHAVGMPTPGLKRASRAIEIEH
jgi:hypothetical protein